MKKLFTIAMLCLASSQVFADLSEPQLFELKRDQGQCEVMSAMITEGGSLVVDYAIGSRPGTTLIMRSDRGVLTENNTIEYVITLVNGTEYIVEVDGAVDTAAIGEINSANVIKIDKIAGLRTISCQ